MSSSIQNLSVCRGTLCDPPCTGSTCLQRFLKRGEQKELKHKTLEVFRVGAGWGRVTVSFFGVPGTELGWTRAASAGWLWLSGAGPAGGAAGAALRQSRRWARSGACCSSSEASGDAVLRRRENTWGLWNGCTIATLCFPVRNQTSSVSLKVAIQEHLPAHA